MIPQPTDSMSYVFSIIYQYKPDGRLAEYLYGSGLDSDDQLLAVADQEFLRQPNVGLKTLEKFKALQEKLRAR